MSTPPPEPYSRWLDTKLPDRVLVIDHVDRGVVYGMTEKLDGSLSRGWRVVRMPLLPFRRRYRKEGT